MSQKNFNYFFFSCAEEILVEDKNVNFRKKKQKKKQKLSSTKEILDESFPSREKFHVLFIFPILDDLDDKPLGLDLPPQAFPKTSTQHMSKALGLCRGD